MISARALGILCYLVSTGESPTVKYLQTVFPEGREAIRTSMQELESLGFVERRNTRIRDRHVKESRITLAGCQFVIDAGFWAHPDLLARVSGSLSLLSGLNNHIHLDSQVSKEYTRKAREGIIIDNNGEIMPYEFFEKTSTDEYLDERKTAMAEKRREYEQAKSEMQQKRIRKRQDIDPLLWTSSDIGYEFADRLQDKWNIKPWSLTQTRFIPALAEMRKRLGTDGKVELVMLDLFFQAVDFQKYDDPQMLWKMFIKRSAELAPQALRMVRTPDQIAEAQVAADKSWDWIEE